MTKKTKAIFISDCHLGSITEPRFVLFLSFIKSLSADKELTHLFLVGDIFDLWIGKHQYFIDKYSDLITSISQLVKRGVSVHYFEGNHDLYLKDFWGESIGVLVHSGPETFQLGSSFVRVEHGDQMDPSDTGYIFLRWFLRSLLIRRIIRGLPDKIILKIGEKAAQSSRLYTSTGSKAEGRLKTLKKFQDFSLELSKTEDWKYLVAGHIHIRNIFEFNKNGRLAINLGVWDESPQFLQLIDDHLPEFLPVKF